MPQDKWTTKPLSESNVLTKKLPVHAWFDNLAVWEFETGSDFDSWKMPVDPKGRAWWNRSGGQSLLEAKSSCPSGRKLGSIHGWPWTLVLVLLLCDGRILSRRRLAFLTNCSVVNLARKLHSDTKLDKQLLPGDSCQCGAKFCLSFMAHIARSLGTGKTCTPANYQTVGLSLFFFFFFFFFLMFGRCRWSTHISNCRPASNTKLCRALSVCSDPESGRSTGPRIDMYVAQCIHVWT